MSMRERWEQHRILTHEELEEVPAGSIVLDSRCVFWEKIDDVEDGGPEPGLPGFVYAFPWEAEAQEKYRQLVAAKTNETKGSSHE